jgi:tRNA(Arg) A34 adenosine deaminase TadA
MLNLLIAAAVAAKPDTDRRRQSLHGAIAVRTDGTIVQARNGSAPNRAPRGHAEARVCLKSDKGAKIYVCRLLKDGKTFANSRPCKSCMNIMRSKGISAVYYSLGENEWGSISLT